MRRVFGSRLAGARPAGRDSAVVGNGAKDSETECDYTPKFRLTGSRVARRWMRGALWTAFTFALMAGTVHTLLEPPAFLLARPSAPEKPAPAWSTIRQPIPVYAFNGGPFDRPADYYTARRHTDGSRIDSLTFGRPGGSANEDGAWMRISLHRIAGPVSETPGFYVDMARLAAIDGLSVGRTSIADLVPTRFGNFAVAYLEIRGHASVTVCLGYRMELASPAFRISGISCGTAANPIDRRMLVCTLNRLDVLSARNDKELSQFFARSELHRDSDCGQGKSAATGSRSAWLDHASAQKAVSALRLRSLPARTRIR